VGADDAGAAGAAGGGAAAAAGELADRTGTFGLTRVTHHWTGTLYENVFEATPWAAYHPAPEAAAATAAPAAAPDFALGLVVDVADPKGQGRVRVRLAWMGQAEHTAWVRVAGLGGGRGRGVGVLPSVGDEVVVAAVAGDPEHLVVLGGLWNGVDAAGHAPGRQHWVTPAGNTLSFVEGAPGEDAEAVELHTKAGKAWVQLAQRGPTGVPTVTVHSEGDLALEAPNGQLRVTAKSYVAHVAGEHATRAGAHTVQSGGAVTVEGGGRVAVKAGGELALRAGGQLRAHGAAGQTLTGATLALNPPGATAPAVAARVPGLPASAWAPRAVPGPGPGRSTEDPTTPTTRELAPRQAQRAALAAGVTPAPARTGSSDVVDPRWTSLDPGGAPAPDAGKAGGTPPKLTPEQQKLHDIKALLNKSATGRAALETLDDNKVPVGFKAGGGSYWDGKKIVIDQTQGTQEAALTLVHEANHALATLKGISGNPLTQTRAAYLSTMVEEEAVGTVQSIVTKRELVAAGVPITATFPLEGQYTSAYNGAVAALAKADPEASAGARAAAGAEAGLARVVQGFTKGEVVTSTNGQPYPAYYGTYWDAVNPPAKKGP
jgi:hypothetical protein